MARQNGGLAASLAAILTLGLAACAPQQESRPAAMSGQGSAGVQGMQGHGMSGMQGHQMHGHQGHSMQGHNMTGMDHRSMMAHCTEMRQQVRQGGRPTPDMQQMMAHCDQMDRSMGSQRRR